MESPVLKRDYDKLYKDIPSDPNGRLESLLATLKTKKLKDDLQNLYSYIQSIKWKRQEYVFYILPKATPRPRSTRLPNGKLLFYVKGANDHKQYLKWYLKDEDIELISTPVKFTCRVYLPIPKSMKNVEKICSELGLIRPVGKPDWDNLAKTYCDMIQGTILQDDKLIVEGHLYKYYSTKPRVEVSLSYMETFDCDFNRKKNVKER